MAYAQYCRSDASTSNGISNANGHGYQDGCITVEDSLLALQGVQQRDSEPFDANKYGCGHIYRDLQFDGTEAEACSYSQQSQSEGYEPFSQTQQISSQNATQPISSGPLVDGEHRSPFSTRREDPTTGYDWLNFIGFMPVSSMKCQKIQSYGAYSFRTHATLIYGKLSSECVYLVVIYDITYKS